MDRLCTRSSQSRFRRVESMTVPRNLQHPTVVALRNQRFATGRTATDDDGSGSGDPRRQSEDDLETCTASLLDRCSGFKDPGLRAHGVDDAASAH